MKTPESHQKALAADAGTLTPKQREALVIIVETALVMLQEDSYREDDGQGTLDHLAAELRRCGEKARTSK